MQPFVDYKFQFHKVGKQELDFEPSDEDTSSDVKYFGFVSYSGSLIIMKMDTSVSTAITYRYYAGQSGYATYWIGRADLSYVLYSQLSTLLD